MKDRARLRLQRLNTYKCRSTDLTHHLPDGETKPGRKEIVIICAPGDILGINKIELFI